LYHWTPPPIYIGVAGPFAQTDLGGNRFWVELLPCPQTECGRQVWDPHGHGSWWHLALTFWNILTVRIILDILKRFKFDVKYLKTYICSMGFWTIPEPYVTSWNHSGTSPMNFGVCSLPLSLLSIHQTHIQSTLTFKCVTQWVRIYVDIFGQPPTCVLLNPCNDSYI
jgi:hypothetical protein